MVRVVVIFVLVVVVVFGVVVVVVHVDKMTMVVVMGLFLVVSAAAGFAVRGVCRWLVADFFAQSLSGHNFCGKRFGFLLGRIWD